ncbi:MAG: type I methionyl aminopeptidase [Acholeplasmatales bacterium]|nr:type I methionyl aminopeptidase [Acholeplasmatales bacterium]
MIKIKSLREIELLRKSGELIYKTHQLLKEYIKPGVSTKQLDEIAENFILSSGAVPGFKGYNDFPATLCTSINEVVVHGIPSAKEILKSGDIISIDIGCIFNGYYGDSAWTYAVGEVSEDAMQLMEITKKSLYEAIKIVKPGIAIGDIGAKIIEVVKPYKYAIVEDFTGHGIGTNLHEDPAIPNFGIAGKGIKLKEGMVICIEPMITNGKKNVRILRDNWTTVTSDKSLACHYEHMVAVTKDGFTILSDGSTSGAGA